MMNTSYIITDVRWRHDRMHELQSAEARISYTDTACQRVATLSNTFQYAQQEDVKSMTAVVGFVLWSAVTVRSKEHQFAISGQGGAWRCPGSLLT